MSTARETSAVEPVDAPLLEVRRRGALLGAVGVGAAAVSTAYLGRALATGAVLDWLLTAVLAAVALLFLVGLLDARSPLVAVTTDQVRVRRGSRWTEVEVAELSDRRADAARRASRRPAAGGGLRRGKGGPARSRHPGRRRGGSHRVLATLLERRDGDTPVEVAVDTAVGTAVSAADETLAGETTSPTGLPHWRDPRPVLASGIAALADRLPTSGSSVVARLRGGDAERRTNAHLVVDGALALAPQLHPDDDTVALVLPESGQLRRPDELGDLLGTADAAEADAAEVEAEGVEGVEAGEQDAEPGEELTEAIVWPVTEPVLGPELGAARRLLGLSLDQLAERTRIPARVIEAVERDDFAVCGGDFYARGHLRTLARVLGLDAAPLVAGYDEHYADRPPSATAPTAGRPVVLSAREPAPPRPSPRWSVLVAAVMAVVLAWSVARLALDTPAPERLAGLSAGSGGVNSGGAAGKAVPVLLRAAGGGAHVVVRDGNGRIAFTGDLSFGESRRLDVVPPIRLDSSDGGVEVVVNGEEQGRLGELGRSASDVYDGG